MTSFGNCAIEVSHQQLATQRTMFSELGATLFFKWRPLWINHEAKEVAVLSFERFAEMAGKKRYACYSNTHAANSLKC